MSDKKKKTFPQHPMKAQSLDVAEIAGVRTKMGTGTVDGVRSNIAAPETAGILDPFVVWQPARSR